MRKKEKDTFNKRKREKIITGKGRLINRSKR